MNRIGTLVFIVVTALLPFSIVAQSLKSGGYNISIKEFAEGETAMVCGPKKPAYGCLLQVKSKDELKGKYYLSLVYMNEKEYIMTVKNSNQSLVNPMLVYSIPNISFQYLVDNQVVNQIAVDTVKPMNEQMLTGMALWLQVRKKLNEEKKVSGIR